jgi:hypothetical protein
VYPVLEYHPEVSELRTATDPKIKLDLLAISGLFATY